MRPTFPTLLLSALLLRGGGLHAQDDGFVPLFDGTDLSGWVEMGASGAFRAEAFDQVKGRSDLWSPWLEQLLLFSMLQHPSGEWTWGRFVHVHPAANVEMADRAARYRALLTDASSFASLTFEEVLASGVLPERAAAEVRERYLLDAES